MNWIGGYTPDLIITRIVRGEHKVMKFPARTDAEAKEIRTTLHEAALRQTEPIEILIMGQPPMMEVWVRKFQ